MPIGHIRAPGWRRIRLLGTLAAVVCAAAMSVPGSASASDEVFCSGVWLSSGWDCRANNPHWLYAVEASVASPGSYRVCAASASGQYGSMNSNWVCDYSYVLKLMYGHTWGVGAIHNGSPYTFMLYAGLQTWF